MYIYIPFGLTVIFPNGRALNFYFFATLSILQIGINLMLYGESVNQTFIKVQIESIICYFALNLYLEYINRSEFMSNQKKILVSSSFKNVIMQLQEGVIV